MISSGFTGLIIMQLTLVVNIIVILSTLHLNFIINDFSDSLDEH
jgi:hypothetical protein